MANTRHEALCDPALAAVRDHHFARLRTLAAGAPPDPPFYLQGIWGHADVDPYQEPERWVREALDNLNGLAERARDTTVFRPLVLEFGPYGVHFVDRILGARVYFHADQWWVERLATPVGTLRAPDLTHSDTWLLAQRFVEAFLASGVTVPVFGLPTLSSPLNTAVNLYGEEFLTSLLQEPQAASHDLGIITELICTLHRWYQQHIPWQQLQPVVAGHRTQPPGCGQICGCSTQLLSPELYRKVIAPLDDAVLRVYPNGGMIHLCGVHVQHIPTWREMLSVRAVQLNDRAAEDFEAYFHGLREDQVIYLNPTPSMTVQRALHISGGRRVVLVAEPDGHDQR